MVGLDALSPAEVHSDKLRRAAESLACYERSMQRWEYLVIVVWQDWVLRCGPSVFATKRSTGSGLSIKSSNKASYHELNGHQVHIDALLNQVGADGWEVVAMSPLETTGERWSDVETRIVCKRSLA